jgi:hypothetical protein
MPKFDRARAEKKAGELLSLMTVINNRLEGMSSVDFKLLSTDAELWKTLANQLRMAGSLSADIHRNCLNLMPWEKP